MTKKTLFLVLVALATLLAFRSPLVAQSRSNVLDKDTFFDMESIGGVNISPDGKQIVFSRSWVDKLKDQYRSTLWIVDVDGGRVRELTTGNRSDSSPVWSPDGKRIAFLSDRDGTNQLHVMWIDTREIAQLTRLEYAPGNIRWSPDGKWIAYTAFIPDNDPILNVKLPERPRGAEWARPAVIVDRLQWGADGRGPVPRGFSHAFVIDAILGGTARQITTGKFNHNSPEWSSDGRTIYVAGLRKPDAEYLRNDFEIYAIDLATLGVKALTDRIGPDANPTVSPKGDWIAYTGYDDKKFTSHVSSIYLMDKSGGAKRLWVGGLMSSPQIVNWALDGSGLYYSVEEKGSSHVYFAPVSGAPKKVTDGVHMLNGLSFSDTGQAAAVRTTFTRPGTLVTFNLRNPSAMKELVDINQDVLEGKKLGEAEELWYTSKDGLKVQGWLIKPANYETWAKVSDGSLDSRRAMVHVFSSIQLGVSEFRGQWLRGPLYKPERKHWIWPGVRQRHSVLVSGQGLR